MLGDVIVCDTIASVKKAMRHVMRYRGCGYDTEGTGLHTRRDRITMHIFTAGDQKTTYIIPIRMCVIPNLPVEQVNEIIKPALESKKLIKYGWNIKFDIHMCANDGIRLKTYFDGMIGSWLLDENRPKTLKERVKDIGIEDHSKFSWATYFRLREQFNTKGLDGMTPKAASTLEQLENDMVEYAELDGLGSIKAGHHVRRLLKEEPVLNKVFYKVWNPFVRTLYEMERTGMAIDIAHLEKSAKLCEKKMLELEQDIYEEAGRPFKIGSTKVLGEILYNDLGLPVISTTKKGAPSTDANTMTMLSRMAVDEITAPYGTDDFEPLYPIVTKILEWRNYSKLYGTYLGPTSSVMKSIENGRIHSSYNGAGTDTGRLSSGGPNMQNIPQSKESNFFIRKAFVAPEGYDLLVGDYSQFELRIIADRTRDKNLVEAYLNDEDLHDKTQTNCNLTQRTIAKNLNFGAMYGIGDDKFAQMLTINTGTLITADEANKYLSDFFDYYSGVPQYQDKLIRKARKRGYVTSYLGRRRRLPEINDPQKWLRARSERQAFNFQIQGGVADIMALVMNKCRTDKILRKYGVKVVGQVHDELHFIVPKKYRKHHDIIKPRISQILEHPFKSDLAVPIKFDLKGPVAHWHDGK